MKRLILLLLSIFYLTNIYAGDTVLLVTLANGSSATFTLAERPTVKFSTDSINIATETIRASYLRQDVKSFTFISDNGYINAIKGTQINYTFINNIFETNAGIILVYNSDGRLIKSGENCVSLQDIANGIYIIKVNYQTFKIIKR